MQAALPNSQVAQGTATGVSAAAVLVRPSHNSQGHVQRPQCTDVGLWCPHTMAPRASAITAHAPHALAPSCTLLTFLYFASRCRFRFFTFAFFHTLQMSFSGHFLIFSTVPWGLGCHLAASRTWMNGGQPTTFQKGWSSTALVLCNLCPWCSFRGNWYGKAHILTKRDTEK